jgi:DNA polymerase III subunit gamma/tau
MDNKPYLVLARRYRPRTFDDVAGQEPVATTLKNAILLKKTGHAYLFTGPRGVGKTSMARIFAKALNCKEGPTVTPCGKCPACTEIDGSRALDVLEIDGASNRGIDEIRALRENVRFAPAAGTYKIYIIDEVHQITTDGFNALLKTLEEPPAHVKFIFATTSAQKVPATILSRCQRFDFRRITTECIVEVLRGICKKEKIKADDDALFLVAKAADGSLRDSQTILDQISASSEGKIGRDDVIRSLGVLEEERLTELVASLGKKDAKAALELLDEILADGKEPVLFVEKTIEHVRNLLFVQVSPELLSLVDATESYKKALLSQKDVFSRDELFYFFSVMMHALNTLKRFEMKRIPLEIALVKIADRTPMRDLAEALEKLKALPAEKKNELKAPDRALSAHPEQPRANAASRGSVEGSKFRPKMPVHEDLGEELPPSDMEIAPVPQRERSVSFEAAWPEFVQAVKAETISVGSYLAEGEPGSFSNGKAMIGFPKRHNFFKETLEIPDNRLLLEKHLSRILGREVLIAFESIREIEKPETPSPEGAPKRPDPDAPPDATIQSAINILGGRMLS